MAKNNSSNQDYTNNADGWDLSGGTTKRKLTISGADIDIVGSGTNTYTFPASAGTLALKSDITGTNSGTNTGDQAYNTLGVTGTPTGSKYLRGDNTWQTPPNTNTTYAEISEAEITTGTASTLRTITARRVTYILGKVRSMLGTEIQFASGKVGINKVPTLGDLDVDGDIYSNGSKLATADAKWAANIGGTRVSSTRQTIASGVTALVDGLTVSYTTGSTSEIVEVSANALVQCNPGTEVYIITDSTKIGTSQYKSATSWEMSCLNGLHTLSASTTYVFGVEVRATGGIATIAAASGDRTVSYRPQIYVKSIGAA